jgi:enoyl-CoA hydratase/carnithine racemase
MSHGPTGDEAEHHLEGGVTLRRAGVRATLTLDRPDVHNAQTPATWRSLAAVPQLLGTDVRVIVVRGAGRSFSAGLDRAMFTAQGIPGEPSLVDLAAMAPQQTDAWIAEAQAGFSWWREHPVVSIAAVHGHAIGAGFQLALACDLVVCADDATFAMKEPVLGLVPDLAGTWPLVAAVGYQRALELCLSGRPVHGTEAAQIGLALRSVPAAELEAAVDALAARVVRAPAGAAAATKRLLAGAGIATPEQQRVQERAAQLGRLADLAAQLVGTSR